MDVILQNCPFCTGINCTLPDFPSSYHQNRMWLAMICIFTKSLCNPWLSMAWQESMEFNLCDYLQVFCGRPARFAVLSTFPVSFPGFLPPLSALLTKLPLVTNLFTKLPLVSRTHSVAGHTLTLNKSWQYIHTHFILIVNFA